jgi:hypothetical protein
MRSTRAISEACSVEGTASAGSGLADLAVFPYGRFDDQVDSTAQFLDWCKSAACEDGIYAYYRMRYEERRRREGAPAV